MKSIANILLVLSSVFLFASCSKNIFSNGETVDRVLEYPDHPFNRLEVLDDVDVTLRHSDAEHPCGTVLVRASESMIDHIQADTSEPGTFKLRNLSPTNWTRPFDAVREVTVYYDTLSAIVFNSNGKLVTDVLHGYDALITIDTTGVVIDTTYVIDNGIVIDTIFTLDSVTYSTEMMLPAFLIETRGGSGECNLQVDCYKLDIHYEAGTADINISGNALIAYAYTDENAHGPIRCNRLKTNIFYITSYGTNIVIAKAFHSVDAHNYNNGIVYYVEYLDQKKIYEHNTSIYVDVWCPETLWFNGDSVSPQSYADDIPGLRRLSE